MYHQNYIIYVWAIWKDLMHNIFSLIHKTAFITGGGSGIGKHIAKTFVNNGAHVILCGRRLAKLEEAKRDIEEQYNHLSSKPSSNVTSQNSIVNIVQLDITDFETLESKIAKITDQFKIDILVNNAGITSKIKKSSWEYELSEWDNIMDTNLKSVWALSNLVGKHMIDNQIYGSIINIASTVAERSMRKNAIYCASKSAHEIEMLVKSIYDLYEPTRNVLTEKIHDWPSVCSLPPLEPDVLEMPIDLVPHALQGWITDVCERWQIPNEMIAVPVLSIFSSLLGCRLGIAPREFDDWVIIPTLWCMLLAPSGSMKSDVLKEALKFVQDIENRNNQKYFEELKIYEARKQGYDENSFDEHPPKHKRLIVCDTTPEKLGIILSDNPNGVLQYQDELSGLLASFTKKGREESRTFYLKAYDGSHYHPIDRVKRGTTILARLCVSILGAIQPDIFKKVFSNILNDGLSGDGFVPRFQMMIYPTIKEKWKNIRRGVDVKAQDRVAKIFNTLSELVFDINDKQEGLEIIPYKDVLVTRFSPEAQVIFDEWLEMNINHQRSGAEENSLMCAYLDKNRKLVPALAMNFQILDYYDLESNNKKSLCVSKESLEKAIQWRDYLETHARKIFGDSAQNGLMLAHSIAKKIQERKIKDGMTMREFKRKGWEKSKDDETRSMAFDILTDHNWLLVEKINTNGKGSDSEVIRLNPSLILSDRNTKSII